MSEPVEKTVPVGWYRGGYHWCDNGGPSIDISIGSEVALVITRLVDDGEADGVFIPLVVFDLLCKGWVAAPPPPDPCWSGDRYHWDDGTRSIDIDAGSGDDLIFVTTSRKLKSGHSVPIPDDEFDRLCEGWLERRAAGDMG